MDFKLVLSKLLTAFKEQDIRYALMGGLKTGCISEQRGFRFFGRIYLFGKL